MCIAGYFRKFSFKKSVCVVINSAKYKITNLLRIYLAGVLLEYVERYNYLGMIIHVRNDDYDISRQLRSILCTYYGESQSVVGKHNLEIMKDN